MPRGASTSARSPPASRTRSGRGLGAVFFDYDGDGRPDLYVANDRSTNVLYRNRGDGTFEDVTVETGAGARDQKAARAGMGIAVGDVDGDGRPEILVTNFAGEPNTLYRNVDGALFDDATESSGVDRASFPYVQWGTDFGDFDDDGRPDLVAASGHLVPRILLIFAKLFRKGGLGLYGFGDRHYKQPPLVWHNEGQRPPRGRRRPDPATGRLCGSRPAGSPSATWTATDASTSCSRPIAGGIHLMKNSTASRAHALEILPVAGADRRTVLGTKVAVTAGGIRQVQEFILRPSYASGAWVPLHFGLGEAASARSRSSRRARRRPTSASRTSPSTASTRCATGSSRRRERSVEGKDWETKRGIS